MEVVACCCQKALALFGPPGALDKEVLHRFWHAAVLAVR